MAHAIHGYSGVCKNIHGHSYELHVTVSSDNNSNGYFPAPVFMLDFKDLKKIVTDSVIEKLDHQLVLSEGFLLEHPFFYSLENLVVFETEPTAENLLLFIQQQLCVILPENIRLVNLKLHETKESFAEWTSAKEQLN